MRMLDRLTQGSHVVVASTSTLQALAYWRRLLHSQGLRLTRVSSTWVRDDDGHKTSCIRIVHYIYHYPFVVGHCPSHVLFYFAQLESYHISRPSPSDFIRNTRGKFLGKSGVPMPAIWSKQWVGLAEGKYLLRLSSQVRQVERIQ